ncbi:MAG: transketolase [Nitrospinota bacterium]|jgi:transketolase|nr:transketolase [Nitrospinota bacterium]|tara:strand:+ start:271 stop:1050 length:780 start_codon:yes stop_codon:yes gene_type:complete
MNSGIANKIRKQIIQLAHGSGSPHVSSALSCADILAVLYFEKMNLEPWAERDIFVLSKAHAAMGLYSTLALKGIINIEELNGYFKNNGTLPAHLDRFTGKGIEVSTGSLGHGFNMALGIAFGFKIKGSKRKVYALVGDGETQEGSIWEGALFAPTLGLDNFTAIIDYNNLQGYGRPKDICQFEPLKSKWESFGWFAIEVDGHNHEELEKAFAKNPEGKPKVIIAHTVKGKGVSFMEDKLIWHYYIVTNEIKEKALADLN